MTDAPTPRSVETSAPRGPAVAGDGRRVGAIAAWTVVVVLLVLGVILIMAKTADTAKAQRIHDDGIAVTARVTYCLGQLGGSGTNAVGFSCTATYEIDGTRYTEPVGGLTTFVKPATVIAAVADPADHSVLVTARSAADSPSSSTGIVVPILVLASGLVLAAVLLVRRRHATARRAATT